jgi:hypothetical protein
MESKVPGVVTESQQKAHVDPEASGFADEVEEKAAVEKELLEKVREAPSTSEGTAGKGTEKTEDVVTPGEAAASVAAAVSAVASAAVIGASIARDAATDKARESVIATQIAATSAAAHLPDSVKENLPEAVQNVIGAPAKEETREQVSPAVPAEVKQSITEAGISPEAAASTEAVEDKKAMEAELLEEVKSVGTATDKAADGAAEEDVHEEVSSAVPAPVKESFSQAGESPEAATNTDAVVEKKTMETELLKEVEPVDAVAEEPREEVSSAVPAAVKESITQAGGSPEAATNTDAVVEKKTVETELLAEIKPTKAADESSGESSGESSQKHAPATTEAPVMTMEAPAATESPATKETPVKAVPATTEAPDTSVAAATTETPAVTASQPTESEAPTNGAKASAEPTTPAKPTEATTPSSGKSADTPSTREKKKKNRLSAMFGKVKAKLAHK